LYQLAMPIDTTRLIPIRRSHRKITDEELRDIDVKRMRGKPSNYI